MSQLREQLIRHEGLRQRPYMDTAGKLTIGVGRNLTDRGLSLDEVNLLLDNDIASAREDVLHAIPWSRQLDTDRFDVLVNMCFNLGIPRLIGFKNFLASLRVGAYDAAAQYMLDSRWATQVGARATELAAIVRGT